MGAGDFDINVEWVFPDGSEPPAVAPDEGVVPPVGGAVRDQDGSDSGGPSKQTAKGRDGSGGIVKGVVAACLVLVAVVLVILVIHAAKAPTPTAVPRPRVVFGSDAAAEAERPAIEGVVRAFHEARTPEEKAAFVRGGQAMLAAMKEYYATHPDEPAVRLFPAGLTVQDTAGPPMVTGRMLYTGDSLVRRWSVEKLSSGQYRLDWRALTGWSGVEWQKFVDRPPAAPAVVRVVAIFDDCWVGQFRDARRYLCLRVSDADNSAEAFAYAESDSVVATSIRHAARLQGCAASEPDPAVMAARESLSLRAGPGPSLDSRPRPGQQSASEFRLTVTLAAVAAADGELLRQFRILEVVRPDWIDPAPGNDAQGPPPKVPAGTEGAVTTQR